MTEGNTTQGAGQVVGLFPELLGIGGIQEASRQIVHALQDILLPLGWSTSYLGLNDPAGPQTLEVGSGPTPFRGYRRSKVRFVARALLLARKNPRIILAAHPNLADPARWMKSIAPASKTIVMCHGVEVWEPLPARRKEALVTADMVLAPSTYTAEKLRSVQGVAAEKIRILPWPIDALMLRLSDAPSSLALPEGFPQGRVILTVGRWVAAERYKGADDMIRAMPQLMNSVPDVRLVLVGNGDDLPRLKDLVAELSLGASVRFYDRLSREQLAACYAHADVFALPSTGEGFGIVFLEAMAFGLPVVGAAVGGVTDIIKDGVNGRLVPGKDIATLVQTLDQLLRDQEMRATLGKKGAEIVREKYQFQAFERRVEGLLAECGMDSRAAA
jgi:phosphatidylinositol alpha-1,6-mannosyltransferase